MSSRTIRRETRVKRELSESSSSRRRRGRMSRDETRRGGRRQREEREREPPRKGRTADLSTVCPLSVP